MPWLSRLTSLTKSRAYNPVYVAYKWYGRKNRLCKITREAYEAKRAQKWIKERATVFKASMHYAHILKPKSNQFPKVPTVCRAIVDARTQHALAPICHPPN